jgi:hypothetical protein
VRAAGFEPAGQVMGIVVLDFSAWLSAIVGPCPG